MYKQRSTRIGVLQVIKDSSNLRIPWPLCLRQECGEDILLPNSQEQSMFLPQGNLQYQAGVLNEAKSNYLATHLEVQNQHVFFSYLGKTSGQCGNWVVTKFICYLGMFDHLEKAWKSTFPQTSIPECQNNVIYISIIHFGCIYESYINIEIYFCLGGCRIYWLIYLFQYVDISLTDFSNTNSFDLTIWNQRKGTICWSGGRLSSHGPCW